MAKYIDLETLEPLDDGDIFIQNTMTNADMIRAMTDEQMAHYINESTGDCPPNSKCQKNCDKCWLDWLKQEVDE